MQDPVLLSGSIADNLRYGRLEATDAEVEEAARAAHAHEFISRLPKGYDTPVAESGGGLSGGERQRLSVARAILKNAPILILDEPTSSLDAISEEIVFSALRRLRAGRTTIVIAHRLSTVRDADRILVLDGGRIAAQGQHEELLKSSQLYRRMCARLSVGKSLDEPETVDELIQAAATAVRATFARARDVRIDARQRTALERRLKILFSARHYRPLSVRRRHLVLADVPARAPRARARGLLRRGHRRVRLRSRAEHAGDGSQLRHDVHPQRARSRSVSAIAGRSSTTTAATTARAPSAVRRYAADADLFLNLSGGSWFWRDEYARIPHKAFIDSDPAFTQLAIAKAEPWYVQFFKQFDHLFTFGSNIGTPASPIPVGEFAWRKTWQPVTLDHWRTDRAAGDRFSTVMTWQIESFTDVGGNKDQEFVKYIDLPVAHRDSRSSSPSTVRSRCCVRTAGRRSTR